MGLAEILRVRPDDLSLAAAAVLEEIKKNPEAVKETIKFDAWGKDCKGLPLHAALLRRLPESAVLGLEKGYPEGVKTLCIDGTGDEYFPLFLALYEKHSEKVVLTLLNAHPEAAKQSGNIDGYHGLPLVLALYEKHSEKVVLALLNAHPEASKQSRNNYGYAYLPLFLALYEEHSEKVVLALLNAHPEAAKQSGNINGYYGLPLVLALYKNHSEKVVLALLNAHPEASKQSGDIDGFDGLPLILALRKNHSEKVVLALLNAHPEAAKQSGNIDGFDGLPLILALYEKHSEKVVLALLNAHPEAAKQSGNIDGFDGLPLILALRKNHSEKVVLALLNAHPEAAKQSGNIDGFDGLPLVLALYEKHSEKVVLALLNAHPEASKQSGNIDGLVCLPLSGAVLWSHSEGVVLAIKEQYPTAMGKRNSQGKLPIKIMLEECLMVEAQCNNLKSRVEGQKDLKGKMDPDLKIGEKMDPLEQDPDDMEKHEQCGMDPQGMEEKKQELEEKLLKLLAADMPISLDGKRLEHFHTWSYCVASTTDIAASVVRKILAPKTDDDGYGFCTHIHYLSEVLDSGGRSALEVSVKGPREAIYKYLLFCGRYKLSMSAPEHISATSVLLRAKDYSNTTDYGAIFDKADRDKSNSLDYKELKALATSIGLEPEIFLKSNGNSISKESFISECKRQLGDGPREVVIKLMGSEENWKREKHARDQNMDSKFVLRLLSDVPSDDKIQNEVDSGSGGLNSIVQEYKLKQPGKYAVFMDAADRNLHQIVYQERPQEGVMRDLLKQLFMAVAHMHENKMMHGDLKMLNVVRLSWDNRLRLIDFDAAAKIFQQGSNDKSYAGAKFSSADVF